MLDAAAASYWEICLFSERIAPKTDLFFLQKIDISTKNFRYDQKIEANISWK